MKFQGLLYSAFTYYTGFKVNSGEYKLMGLAPYGRPRYADLIKQHLIDIKPDGSYRLALEYFDYCVGLRMTNAKFHDLFGGPPRAPESKLRERDADLAASVQSVLCLRQFPLLFLDIPIKAFSFCKQMSHGLAALVNQAPGPPEQA